MGFADALEDAGLVAGRGGLGGSAAQDVYGGFEGVDEGGAGGTFGDVGADFLAQRGL